jgi:glycyl-tRNA synthetase beta chain
MSTQDFLVEIGTEELPPKALNLLSRSFATSVASGLKKQSLTCGQIKQFATPRRLALIVPDLCEHQEDREIEKFGPAVKAAFDESGAPTPAASGFARSCGVEVSALQTGLKDGVEKLVFRSSQKGSATSSLLPEIISSALEALPIPKRMRWGSARTEFVRPVHWVILLFGENLIEASLLGVSSNTFSFGHRFHHNEKIEISSPSEYEEKLANPGFVIADFDKRKQLINKLVLEQGTALKATAVIDEKLLDEVTGLVEYPVALTGNFDRNFLDVPQEALVSAMKTHQKYFYLVDKDNVLMPHFITVSNIKSTDPEQVIQGNERVIRPRLADARFFFETDKKQPLEQMQRVSQLSAAIANELNLSESDCQRAAMLSKCDLATNMVNEFADLQGLMGYYYALNDGEPDAVATALSEQYLPRFSGDELPKTDVGSVLAIADKLDTITGLFVIGQPPTGSKDPFALRRSAIGILRILVENKFNLDLLSCIKTAVSGFDFLQKSDSVANDIFDFMLERFRALYLEDGVPSEVFQSVHALKPTVPLDFHYRILAVHNFSALEQANSLAAANKRVSNILDQVTMDASNVELNDDLLVEDSEKKLAENLSRIMLDVAPMFEGRDYTQGLEVLALLKDDVDSFFDSVLVMSDDDALRVNRIALLRKLRDLFLKVADISYLCRS